MLLALCALSLSASASEAPPVYGGGPVNPGDWPDTAAILDRRGDVFCTGTLIAPDVVLSAAHCATGGSATPAEVVLSSDDTDGGERIAVRSYTLYDRWMKTYDVAVLVLELSLIHI